MASSHKALSMQNWTLISYQQKVIKKLEPHGFAWGAFLFGSWAHSGLLVLLMW